MTPARVLVVEDEAIIAEDIGSSLRNLGYAISGVASTGEEAVAKAQELRPNLVLMDIMLQGEMDGVEAADAILRQCDIPVVYLTAHTDEITIQRAKLTEPYSYVIKPYEEKELQIAIEMALYNHEVKSKLRRVENWFATTLRSIGDAVIATDRTGVVTFMNPMAERLTGWSRRDAYGHNLNEIFQIQLADGSQPAEDRIERTLREGLVIGSADQTVLISRAGRSIPIHESSAQIRDDRQNVIGVVLVFRDITELRKEEGLLRDQLREVEIRYQSLVEQIPAIIYIGRISPIGSWLYVSPQVAGILGYTPDEWMRELNNWSSHLHPDDRESVLAGFASAMADQLPLHFEYRMLGKGGNVVWVRDDAVVLKDPAGAPLMLHGVLTDISKRKEAEDEVTRSHLQMRALAARLHSVREEERSRIAREIHDELGQVLTGLKIDVSWLSTHGPEPDKKYKEKINSMLKLIDTTIETVRKISLELRPGMLDDLGLAAAIEWETNDFQRRTGIRCRFRSNMDEVRLESGISTAVFRILQEALTNIARHAKASRVDVELKQNTHDILLEVRDNGVGIPAGGISNKKSLGILGMRERAHALGGEVDVASPGKGTCVSARIPLTAPSELL